MKAKMSYDKCIIFLEDKSMPLLIFHVSNNLAALQHILVSKSLYISLLGRYAELPEKDWAKFLWS